MTKMNSEDKMQLIRRNTEEIVTEEQLKEVMKKKNPVHKNKAAEPMSNVVQIRRRG